MDIEDSLNLVAAGTIPAMTPAWRDVEQFVDDLPDDRLLWAANTVALALNVLADSRPERWPDTDYGGAVRRWSRVLDVIAFRLNTRLSGRRLEEAASSLQEIVVQVSEAPGADPQAVEDLRRQLDAVRVELATQPKRVELSPAEQLDLDLRRQEARRTFWATFLARESVGTLVGALLLLGFGSAVITAMFRGVEIPQLVTTIIGAVLGYFFGQSGKHGDG